MLDVTREQLIGMRKLIEDPSRWTTNTYARDKDGKVVEPNDENAACWCLVGAQRCVGNGIEWYAMRDLLLHTADVYFQHFRSLGEFNDEYGHANVLELIGYALEYGQLHTWN